jgi:hypothetical protein
MMCLPRIHRPFVKLPLTARVNQESGVQMLRIPSAVAESKQFADPIYIATVRDYR